MGNAEKNRPPDKYLLICIYVGLALTTLAVYWQVRNYDFISFDDRKYVSENQNVQSGLTLDGIKWAFTTTRASNWHPLTWLSHMLDCELFGLKPGRHHSINVLFHIANTLLLFTVLKRMTRAVWRSAFVAAIFALHPLHVESVAWIAERKDVLSTFFWILTMGCYVRYVEKPGVGRYLSVLLAFALGLMAKPMLVTLPFVLLLLDYWPLGRIQPGKKTAKPVASSGFAARALIAEKIPLFFLSAASAAVTFIAQRCGGAVAPIGDLALMFRIANACISYLRYFGQMVWPVRLAMFYPHPRETVSLAAGAMSALLLVAVSIWIIRSARSHRYLLVGWLWYLGTLVPVIGLVQVGNQAHADRYTYVPLTGLFIIVAWGLVDLLAKVKYRRIVLVASALVVLLPLAVCARFQQQHWQNSETLFGHALKVTDGYYKVHCILADHFNKTGKFDQAVTHFSEALQRRPNNANIHYSLGSVLNRQGRFSRAIPHFTEALRLNPELEKAHCRLGDALHKQGRPEKAIGHYREALRLKPDWAVPMNQLAWLLATNKQTQFRNPKEAIGLAERACELTGYEEPTVLDTLAAAYAAAGRFSDAVDAAHKALELLSSSQQKKLIEEIQGRLRLFKASRPYIERSPQDRTD